SVVAVGLIVHFTAPKCDPHPPPTTAPPATTLAPTAGPTTAPPLVTDVRLPTGVKPLHYTVTLAPYIYGNNASEFYFTGSMKVRLSINESTSNIKLHATKILLTAADIRVYNSTSNKNYTVDSCMYDKDREWYSIDLSVPLPANSTDVVIEIAWFRAPLRSDLRGLYLSSYPENGTTKYLATSHLQPTDARKTFPCFDEPAFKATFDVSLVRRSDYISISNMPSIRTTNVSASTWFSEMTDSEQLVKEDFETTPIMSTYLLAFIVSQFELIRGMDTQGRKYRNWARPEFVNQTDYSLDVVRNITEYFEWYFNVPYPLNKTDQAAVPDFNAGAMENWGLIIYREGRLVFNGTRDTSAIKHQINEIFDTITYRKGATVLRMLHGFVGDEVFRKGVGNYLRQNSYGNTFHTALYDSLTQQYSKSTNKSLDVGLVMDRWIKQMGYPVLNCSVSTAARRLTLTQNHFLSDPSQVPSYPSDYNYTWIIPVTMGTKQNLSSGTPEDVSGFVNWMNEKEQSFEFNNSADDWYLLNLRSSGFYRVNYDLDNWKRLIDQLVSNHTVFSPQDRARLLDDSFALASAGYLDYSIPLNMTKYLKSETHYVPWSSALSKIGYLHSMLHRQSPEYGPLSAYMRDLLEGAFNDVGLDNKDTDTHLTKLKRGLIVSSACLYRLRSCETAATNKFEEFVNSSFTSTITPDIRRRVLCEGVATSFVAVWDRLFEFSKTVAHPGTQNDIIRSLACTNEPWILNRYLDYALDESKIRRQDVSTVFSSVAANPNGLQIVWDFLQRNWNQIQEVVPGAFTISYFINNLADFNNAQKLAEMERFKEENSLGAATRAMDLALESVRINIKWMESNLPSLRAWLSENVQSA
uniref:Aminopeptidase n=1 Tax=Macrostomum lignano TaxID=282301 RepID=A0A1I8GVI5_9PLAT